VGVSSDSLAREAAAEPPTEGICAGSGRRALLADEVVEVVIAEIEDDDDSADCADA
jgi:hypothetical protein